ncbi:hypothetical protein PMAYCL1PPCAC_04899, partial [Pristionchus mayeri]
AILRTTISSFALASADIIGNIIALYIFLWTIHLKRKEDRATFVTSMHFWIETEQVISLLREVLFPILLTGLFGQVRCLLLGTIKSNSKPGQPPNSRNAKLSGSSTQSARKQPANGTISDRRSLLLFQTSQTIADSTARPLLTTSC